MQVVDRIGVPPGICFICEMTPTEVQTVVDTQRDFEPGGPTYLNGRKIVCEGCAHHFAKLYGFISAKEVEDLQLDRDFLFARVSELEDRARQVAEQILGNAAIEPRVRVAEKPAPKKAAKVAVEK